MHIDPLMRAGLLVVSPVKAKENPDLYGLGGSTHERHVTDDGTEHYAPLAYRLKAQTGAPGKRRWYHEVTVPCARNGDHEILVPLHVTQDDRERVLNRPEYLRQLPPATDDYDRAYGYRPDSESFDCQAEAAFSFHRLPAYGAARQTLVMLGFAMSENAVSRYHHEAHRGPGRQPAGTARRRLTATRHTHHPPGRPAASPHAASG